MLPANVPVRNCEGSTVAAIGVGAEPALELMESQLSRKRYVMAADALYGNDARLLNTFDATMRGLWLPACRLKTRGFGVTDSKGASAELRNRFS